MSQFNYDSFLQSITAHAWKKIGIKRRAGVATPLFSIYSKKSIGVGDLYDLKLLIDWASSCGLSIIQLLPMNDVDFHFVPYNAQSTFALEPMYLSLEHLTEINLRRFQSEIKKIRTHFPPGGSANYEVKRAKLEFLWTIFKSFKKPSTKFATFINVNQYWLKDYALFKTAKEIFGGKSWEDWPVELSARQSRALSVLENDHKGLIEFHMWLQWQLCVQFKEIKAYAQMKKVFLMGDLPFLVSRDSADVWSHPNYFKLDFSSGAPPDAYFAKGQRWGTPPYHWSLIASDSYRYIVERLRYAEEFYDLFRIDHAVGFFRLWTIPISEPQENGGLNGRFDPPDERDWESHGRKLLFILAQNTKMLPCAEDLGTVPECSFRVLKEFGIPGTDIQRWSKDETQNFEFKDPKDYRGNSAAAISTHDMTAFNGWWEYETETVYDALFERACLSHGIDFNRIKPELFDLDKSAYDRLRWKEHLSEDDFIRILGKPKEEISDIIDFYRYSFHEREHFWRFVGLSGTYQEKSSPELLQAALRRANETASIFSIQMLQDFLSIEAGLFKGNSWETRINFPGTVGNQNWSLVMPISLEKMKQLSINSKIKTMNQQTERSN